MRCSLGRNPPAQPSHLWDPRDMSMTRRLGAAAASPQRRAFETRVIGWLVPLGRGCERVPHPEVGDEESVSRNIEALAHCDEAHSRGMHAVRRVQQRGT